VQSVYPPLLSFWGKPQLLRQRRFFPRFTSTTTTSILLYSALLDYHYTPPPLSLPTQTSHHDYRPSSQERNHWAWESWLVRRLVDGPSADAASMRLSLPLAVRNVSRLHVLVAFFFVDWLFYATTPSISPLHTSFFSSVLLWMYGSARAGHGLAEEITATRARCWGAGAFFALGQLCQRAAGDVSALWWSNVCQCVSMSWPNSDP